MNAKPKINQNLAAVLPSPRPADWSHLQHVKTLMGLSRSRLGKDEVLRLIDSRQIQWAWDIARKGARRPEVRLWRESLVDYLARENGGAVPPTGDLTLAQIIAAILPHPGALSARAAVVGSSELQRRFLCCQGHLAGLIADGELCCVEPVRRNRQPAILYQSAFEFLKRRSMSV
jgi:hypothetical protein